ncbi:MAG: 16S rRNA (uracil(1498)-N(3))-methyltransferase [Candidatus Binatia bacterium]|nr:16S rRNA (uracil(1498)-N(3))-methyltransferase [Candidatus Binatia bacterium]
MNRPRFFVPSAHIHHSSATLAGAEFHHLRHVLRLGCGDTITLCDDTGREHEGVITALTATTADITLLSSTSASSPFLSLTLAQGLLKGPKMDLVVAKATELGVSRIVPFSSAFTVALPPHERRGERLARWQRIARSAVKQAGTRPPVITPPQPFHDLLQTVPHDAGKVLFYEKESTVTVKSLLHIYDGPLPALWIVIGPEGGFAPEEVAHARTCGFHIASLGPWTLRAETASIVAVAFCQLLWGDRGPLLPSSRELP